MIKSVDFPNREFASKEELFKHLKDNEAELIAIKKSDIRKSEGLVTSVLTKEAGAAKGIAMEDGYIYPIINSTRFLDSHKDLHIDGIWDRSVQDQKGKLYYVADHEMKLSSVIAYPADVTPMTAVVSFADLGYKNYEGNTQVLIFKVPKDKIRMPAAKAVIDERIDIEHSVRMQYVSMQMCIDSPDAEYKAYKTKWDMYYPYMANKSAAEDGYFWAVTEAKIHKEGSMVLAGSNSVTPMLQNDNAPLASMQEKEAAPSTSTVNMKHLL